MIIEIVDRTAGRYRCEYGEFSCFPETLGDGPPPRIAAFNHWAMRGDPRFAHRCADDVDVVDVTHQGSVWTYKLDVASIAVPATNVPGVYEIQQMFSVGVLAD